MWVSSGPQVDAGLQSQDKGWAGEAAALDTVVYPQGDWGEGICVGRGNFGGGRW